MMEGRVEPYAGSQKLFTNLPLQKVGKILVLVRN